MDALIESVQQDETAPDRVSRVIYRGIETGRYAPGQRLVEVDLCRELDVSRNSLREAFQRLNADGLLEIIPNRGALVRRFSRQDIVHIQQVRDVVEPLAAYLAAKAINNGDNRERFQQASRIWLRDPPIDELDEYVEENRRFQRIVVEFGGNDHLLRVMERLNLPLFSAHFRSKITRSFRAERAKEHAALAKAILAGDASRARMLSKKHLAFATKIILSVEE